MQDEEWGAFGAAADHTLALDPADHPRDVPTAQGEGTGGVKGGDDSVVDRVEDDDDFADFEAAPATPTQEDADDESLSGHSYSYFETASSCTTPPPTLFSPQAPLLSPAGDVPHKSIPSES